MEKSVLNSAENHNNAHHALLIGSSLVRCYSVHPALQSYRRSSRHKAVYSTMSEDLQWILLNLMSLEDVLIVGGAPPLPRNLAGCVKYRHFEGRETKYIQLFCFAGGESLVLALIYAANAICLITAGGRSGSAPCTGHGEQVFTIQV